MARPDGRLLIIALLLSLLKLPAELVVNLGKGIRQVNNWYKHTTVKTLLVSLHLGAKNTSCFLGIRLKNTSYYLQLDTGTYLLQIKMSFLGEHLPKNKKNPFSLERGSLGNL